MVLIKNALANIKASKLRVFAAMIWIVLGITSVVIVASVGNGLEAKIGEASDDASQRTVTLEFYPTYNEMSSFIQPFSHKIIEDIALLEYVENIDTTGGGSGNSSLSTEIIYEEQDARGTITGYTMKETVKVEYGREFGYEDEERKVIILGHRAAINLFNNPQDALGKMVTVSDTDFQVIGVAPKDNSIKDEYESSELSYLPKAALDRLLTPYTSETTVGLTNINITLLPGYDVMETAWIIADMLNLQYGEEDGSYFANTKTNDLTELQVIQSYISEFTTMLTAASLFIGGIGIMNIMYMSVMERRREIGIRRAIGAKPRNILTQFLIESVVITSLGGIVGIIVGILVSIVVSKMLPFKIVPTIASYAYAVGASILIGVIFGVIPAIKASRMDPIKAIQGHN